MMYSRFNAQFQSSNTLFAHWIWKQKTIFCLLWFILISISTASASPADPDRPIPKTLLKIPYTDTRIEASSVTRGFSTQNLFRMKAWRAWGSEPSEREGAWLKFFWPEVYYLDTIHYVPGDERAPGFFDQECGRPARIKVRSDLETRDLDLEDVRGHQYLIFDPPLVTRSLELLITEVRGKSKAGGVCLAAISFYAHRHPMKSIKGLKRRAEEAFIDLKAPLKRIEASHQLKKVGPAVAPLLLHHIRESHGEQQQRLLEIAPELLSQEDLATLNQLAKKISKESQAVFLRARAALGDQDATSELIEKIDELKPQEQASILSSVARAHEPTRLAFLLKKYGHHPEVDEALKVHLPYFKNAYQEALALYKKTTGQRQAALLELIAKLDAKQSLSLIQQGIAQRKDPMLRSGAIRGAAYSPEPSLRPLVRRLSSSVYVIERRAVAFALSQWGATQDSELLRELAGDKAMSVRQEAMIGLGRLGGADDLLRGFALYGSDESTAETAAKAWLSGEARQDVKTPIKLLSSPFERVRAHALLALSDHQAAACQPLVSELLRVDPIYTEHVQILDQLWEHCSQIFMKTVLNASSTTQLRALSMSKQLARPELRPLIIKLATTDDPELQIAVAEASGVLSAIEAETAIGDYLKSDFITTQCAALKALAQKQSKLTIPVIKHHIQKGLKDPYQSDRALLLCALEAAGEHRSSELNELLGMAYQSWSRSLGFVSYRLKAIRSLAKLPNNPARLETLIKASTDLDRQVREAAFQGLRQK